MSAQASTKKEKDNSMAGEYGASGLDRPELGLLCWAVH